MGSILYLNSSDGSEPGGPGAHGASDSGAGPTIKQGHMIVSDFSRCSVSNLPEREPECSDSAEENEDVHDALARGDVG